MKTDFLEATDGRCAEYPHRSRSCVWNGMGVRSSVDDCSGTGVLGRSPGMAEPCGLSSSIPADGDLRCDLQPARDWRIGCRQVAGYSGAKYCAFPSDPFSVWRR